MTPDTLFGIGASLAPIGWLVLLVSPWLPERVRGPAVLAVPLALSVLYVAVMLVHWGDAPGGFDSLQAVATLFTDPAMVVAGWVHFLAFDLLVGAWITTTARRESIGFGWVVPCLALTFLFGPAGFLAFSILRLARGTARRDAGREDARAAPSFASSALQQETDR